MRSPSNNLGLRANLFAVSSMAFVIETVLFGLIMTISFCLPSSERFITKLSRLRSPCSNFQVLRQFTGSNGLVTDVLMLVVDDYVPLFRVCTIARRPNPSFTLVPRIPEDVCYVPKELKCLAARAVPSGLPSSGLPEDLQELVQKENENEDYLHFYVKSRECPVLQAGGMKVGEFHQVYPSFDSECCKNMFSVDLIGNAKKVLHLLNRCSKTAGLYDPGVLYQSCCKRYPAFMELQLEFKEKALVPPLDVALVQWTHMLQSKEYRSYAESLGIHEKPHSYLLDKEEFEKCEELTRTLWEERITDSKYDFSAPSLESTGPFMGSNAMTCGVQAEDPRIQASYTTSTPQSQMKAIELVRMGKVATAATAEELKHLPGIVADDRKWFPNFVSAMGEDFEDIDFEKCHIGYQKYLYLLTKYPRRMEWISFAPNPAIDLMWHTHLATPKAYWKDVSFVMCVESSLPMHKLLPAEARTPFVFEKHLNEETRLWEDEFPGDLMKSYVKYARQARTKNVPSPPPRLQRGNNNNAPPPPPPILRK